ncbi:MAG: glutathione S-transferase family protein [Deltaproteobacteria bacterium]|nr:glutathione S-transferase family protein [Deltaproteobacteria bacterium]MDQ3298303.1 glutathione S-transferase family protein [Myxococcota bacterium]
MTKAKLTYFDLAGSRGEECRLALHLAGIEFEDIRIKFAEWPALKPTTPFGGMPILELPGKPPLSQSNAILVLVGRRHGLHPADDFEAARHEALMLHVEDLRHAVGPTLRIKDPDHKRTAREELATLVIPTWAAATERQLQEGPFVAGAKLQVVDLKLFMVARWFVAGTVDHIPATVFDPFPKLTRLYKAVAEHEGVKAWYARTPT